MNTVFYGPQSCCSFGSLGHNLLPLPWRLLTFHTAKSTSRFHNALSSESPSKTVWYKTSYVCASWLNLTLNLVVLRSCASAARRKIKQNTLPVVAAPAQSEFLLFMLLLNIYKCVNWRVIAWLLNFENLRWIDKNGTEIRCCFACR